MKTTEDQVPTNTPEQVRAPRTILLYYILMHIEQVVFSRTTYSPNAADTRAEVVRALRTCLTKNNWRIIEYFEEHGVASGYILRRKLSMARQSVYDAIDFLGEYDLIHPVTKLPATAKRKKGPVMWGWMNSTERQALIAISLYNRLTDPMFMKAEKTAMDFIENVMFKDKLRETKRAQILAFLDEKRIPKADTRVFTEVITKLLRENDYTVWL